jgi:hypothetical protein
MNSTYLQLIPKDIKEELNEYRFNTIIIRFHKDYVDAINLERETRKEFTDDSTFYFSVMCSCDKHTWRFLTIELEIYVSSLRSFITQQSNKFCYEIRDKLSDIGIFYLIDDKENKIIHIDIENQERSYCLYDLTQVQSHVLLSKLQHLIIDIDNNTLQCEY